jgi:hypothetical protein
MHIPYNALVPSVVAILSGTGSAIVQSASSTQVSPALAMLVPIVSALIGGAVSYGILKGTVQAVKESHAGMAKSVDDINRNFTNLVGRVSNIEGRIGRRRSDPHLDYDQ